MNPTLQLSSCGPLRGQVWERDEGICQRCGKTVRRDKRDRYDSGRDLGEIDHILARRDGGLTTLENLQLLCLACNRRKAADAVIARNQA